MRATFIHGIRDVRLGEVEPPRPREGMVTIQVAGCGICGSDLHYYLEGGIGAAQVRDPFVPGHEFAGWVVDDHPALGLSRGSIKVLLSRARGRLRDQLVAKGLTARA